MTDQNICVSLVERVGVASLLEPCETWPLTTQDRILQDFSSPEAIRQRMAQWLTYVFDNRPLLVAQKDEAQMFLRQLLKTAEPMGVEQAVYLPFLARELGALDYADVRITAEGDLHSPHPTFRNEWWNLTGRLSNGDALTWQAWRHTVVPVSQWTTGVDPRGYSALRFSWSCGRGETKHSPWMLESWGLGSVSKEPRFQAHCGRIHQLTSRQSDALFPMDLEWDGVTLSNLDHIKPLMMLHSNACLSCSDGIGIKMYMYPEVKNDGFTGYFSHGWEAGVMPEGFSSNAALRGVVNIERSLLYPPDTPRSDQWLSVKAQLDNGFDLWAFFLSSESQHPHRVVVSNSSGAVLKINQHEVDLVRQDGLVSAVVRHPQFSLQWVLDQPTLTSRRQTLTTLSHGHISGVWRFGVEAKEDFVQGFMILESPDLRTYNERASEILREVFPHAGALTHAYFNQAYFSASTDVLTSVALWLLPVMFGLVLLMTVVYLLLSQTKPYPWIRQEKGWWRASWT